jgi:hypothetical protein
MCAADQQGVFASEALGGCRLAARSGGLDRDLAPVRWIPSEPHHAPGSATDLAEQLVAGFRVRAHRGIIARRPCSEKATLVLPA